MPYYYVTGKLWASGGCNCPDCNDDHIEKSGRECHLIQAQSPEEAAEKVLEKVAPDLLHQDLCLVDCGWVDPPEIKDAPEDCVMRSVGAPTLFDLDTN